MVVAAALKRADWAALAGVVCYFASWQLARLYLGTDEYWLALRLYPLGLLLTITLYIAVLFGGLIAAYFGQLRVTLAACLIWFILLALEVNEVFVYATCKLLSNPLLDETGSRIGEQDMAVIWGVTVYKSACGRLFDLPADLLSYLMVPFVLWIFWRAWRA